MGRNFMNKHHRGKFEHKLLKLTHQKHIGRKLKKEIKKAEKGLGSSIKQGFQDAGSSIKQGFEDAGSAIKKDIKKIPFKKIGQTTVLAGEILQAVGTITDQPELIAAGVGLEVVGEIEKGGSFKKITSAIGSDIVGSFIGGPLGSQIGAALGSAVGGALDTKRDEFFDENDKTHHGTIVNNIKENQHIDDKEQHHNSVLLPDNLQASGITKTDVGAKLLNPSTDTSKKEFEEDVDGLKTARDIMEFLTNNFSQFETLSEQEKSDIFSDALKTNLFDELFKNIDSL